MLRKPQPIFKLFWFSPLKLLPTLLAVTFALAFTGCVTSANQQVDGRLKAGEPVSRVYYAKYDEVELAVKQAMIRYPQRIDNTEAGFFETDYVKGEARFRSPHRKNDFSPGYRYRLVIRLVRGREDGKPAIKVSVAKLIEIARDFFSNPDALSSDGLEEDVILYRIGREIEVSRALSAAAPATPQN